LEPILPLLLTVVLTRQLSKIQHSTHRVRLCVLCESRNKGESKNVKFTIEPATKTHFFFNLGGRWGCWSTPLLGGFTPGKETRYLLCSRLGLPQDQSGRVGKNIVSTGIFFFYSLIRCLYFIRTWFSTLIVMYFAFYFYLQHTTQTFMPLAGIEPATPASEQSQTLALDRSVKRKASIPGPSRLYRVAVPTPSLRPTDR
jgi:hypothetical protein